MNPKIDKIKFALHKTKLRVVFIQFFFSLEAHPISKEKTMNRTLWISMIALTLTSSAFAGLEMKPGLWKVEMKIGGGEHGAKIQKAQEMMAGIPEAQRKQMMAMMEKMGGKKTAGLSNLSDMMPGKDGMKICYSKEMLEKPENLGKFDKNKKCDVKVKTTTSKLVEIEIACEDGTKGNGTFKVIDSENYEGKIAIDSKKAGKLEIEQKAKFASADCGKVKPIK